MAKIDYTFPIEKVHGKLSKKHKIGSKKIACHIFLWRAIFVGYSYLAYWLERLFPLSIRLTAYPFTRL